MFFHCFPYDYMKNILIFVWILFNYLLTNLLQLFCMTDLWKWIRLDNFDTDRYTSWTNYFHNFHFCLRHKNEDLKYPIWWNWTWKAIFSCFKRLERRSEKDTRKNVHLMPKEEVQHFQLCFLPASCPDSNLADSSESCYHFHRTQE